MGALIVAIVIFAFLCILLGVATYLLQRSNKSLKVNSLMLPFASTTVVLDDNKKPTFSVKPSPNGRQQMTCPSGKINVLGAFFDVYDPYNSCSTTPNQAYSTECKDPANKNQPICQNLNGNQQNTTCVDGGSGNCKMRDVSHIIAKACNGKTECTEADLQGVLSQLPYPCNILPTDAAYATLPVSQGSDGSTTSGYYLHGLFTCQVD